MKVLKIIAITIALLVLVAVAVGFFLPTEYSVSRSVRIAASPEKVHELVGDLKRWDDWTPFKADDPTVVVTLGDKTAGVGAHQSWTGDSGNGELTFTASDPKTGVEYDMSMNDGAYKCKGIVRYVPQGDSTEVSWSMSGDMDTPVIGGYFVLIMDAAVGPMFQKGLDKLKLVAEGK